MSGKVVKVSGPLVVATALADANMSDVVRVGPQRLIGEILTMKGDTANIQVYEETSGLGPGAEVETTGAPMSVELGPGMIEGIYDGIQRPLEKIVEKVGACITRGVEVPAVDHEKKWEFNAVAKVGDQVIGGDILGTVQETAVVLHKIMVPPTMRGTITSIQSGSFNVTETIATLKTEDGREVPLTMLQKWPVRVGRPYTKKYPPKRPLCSGQRIIDTMFPIAKGGTAAVPGPFGSGKTVAQLLGEVETRSARTLVLEPGAYPSALVLANFKDKDVDTLLDLLKQAQVNIPLKAVVTPANRSWVFGDLLAHLQEEHTAFTAAKESQTV